MDRMAAQIKKTSASHRQNRVKAVRAQVRSQRVLKGAAGESHRLSRGTTQDRGPLTLHGCTRHHAQRQPLGQLVERDADRQDGNHRVSRRQVSVEGAVHSGGDQQRRRESVQARRAVVMFMPRRAGGAHGMDVPVDNPQQRESSSSPRECREPSEKSGHLRKNPECGNAQ